MFHYLKISSPKLIKISPMVHLVKDSNLNMSFGKYFTRAINVENILHQEKSLDVNRHVGMCNINRDETTKTNHQNN